MTTQGPSSLGWSSYFNWYAGVAFDNALGAGTFVDPQGLKLTYSATLADGEALPSWITLDAATGTFSGTVPSSYQSVNFTQMQIILTATDSAGLSGSQTENVDIYKVLAPSQSNFAPTVHVLPGHEFNSRMPSDIFSDPQGFSMTYWASSGNGGPLPSWLTFDPATLTFAGTMPSTVRDNYTVQLHATDSAGQTGTVWFTMWISAGPPNLSDPTPDQSWALGQPVNLKLPSDSFTDPQNETLTYSVIGANGQQIPDWLHFNAKTLTFTGTPPNSEAGLTLGIQLTATDSDNQSSSEIFHVSFSGQGSPVLETPIAAQSWMPGQQVSLSLPAGSFADPQNLALTYSAKSADGSALPSWLHFDPSTQTFSGTAPTIPASLGLEVVATNSAGASTGEVFTAIIGQPNAGFSPPNLTDPTAAQGWAVGQAVSLTLAADTFTDPQGLKLTYSASNGSDGTPLPSWLSFNPATLTFTGTVPASGAELGIQVTATDSAGQSASETFAVMADWSPTTIVQLQATIPDSSWTVGQPISIAIPAGSFNDPNGLALTFSGTLTDGSALPSWLKVDPNSGQISGTAPLSGQSLGIRITASDNSGYTGHDDFRLNVPAPYPPELKDSTLDQVWNAGQQVKLVLPDDSFSDPQGEALTYAATLSDGTALPAWLHFDPASKSFSGTVPNIASPLTVTVTATDTSNLSDSETFGITTLSAAATPVVMVNLMGVMGMGWFQQVAHGRP